MLGGIKGRAYYCTKNILGHVALHTKQGYRSLRSYLSIGLSRAHETAPYARPIAVELTTPYTCLKHEGCLAGCVPASDRKLRKQPPEISVESPALFGICESLPSMEVKLFASFHGKFW